MGFPGESTASPVIVVAPELIYLRQMGLLTPGSGGLQADQISYSGPLDGPKDYYDDVTLVGAYALFQKMRSLEMGDIYFPFYPAGEIAGLDAIIDSDGSHFTLMDRQSGFISGKLPFGTFSITDLRFGQDELYGYEDSSNYNYEVLFTDQFIQKFYPLN